MILKAGFDFERATDKFYEVLFEKMPALEIMFADKHKQTSMFIVALQSIGDKARGDTQLADYLKMLGDKHKGFGLLRIHMEMGREAFEQALEAGSKDASDEEKQHYLKAFTELERSMGFGVDGADKS